LTAGRDESNFRRASGHYTGVRSYSEVSDGDLVSMAAKDPEAFGELFRRHSHAVYAYCARRTGDLHLAEDLTSVTFLEAFRRRRTLQLSSASALPWLLGVANNVARNAERSVRRYRSALERIVPPPDGTSAEEVAVEHIGAQEALARAIEVLRQLSPAERDIVHLVLWSELSYADAASLLGVPVGTVRSRLASARQKLAAVAISATLSQEH